MKFVSVKEMKDYANSLVNMRVKDFYKTDWTKIDSMSFDGFAEEARDKKLSHTLFIVWTCGTYLLPIRYVPDHSRSELSISGRSIAEYYADESLSGSKDVHFYMIDFENLTVVQKTASQAKCFAEYKEQANT